MSVDEQTPFHEQTTVKDILLERPAWPPPPRPRPPQGPSKATKITVIVLASLLIASGLSFVIYTTTVQYGLAIGAARRLNINATVRSKVREQATLVSSLQATAQPLATQQAQIIASATAQALPSVTAQAASDDATATATSMGTLLTQDTTGTPALNDPLSDNSLNNSWDKGYTDNNNTGCNFVNGSYRVQEARRGFIFPCFADATNFSNFVYQVSMTIVAGNEGGIIFRANKDTGQYYLFRIDISGAYALELYNKSAYTLLASGTSSAIYPNLNQPNTLTVIANKGALYLFVNQSYVGGASDTTLSSGQIGVAVFNTDLPVVADFSNAEVWKL
jgi:hypothetical protein